MVVVVALWLARWWCLVQDVFDFLLYFFRIEWPAEIVALAEVRPNIFAEQALHVVGVKFVRAF